MATATKPDARTRVENAVAQLRDALSELPDRMRGEATETERTFGRIGDDALREIARLAIRAQRSPAALKELSAEIRKRKAELTT